MKKLSVVLMLFVLFSSFAFSQEVAPFGFRPGMTVEQARG